MSDPNCVEINLPCSSNQPCCNGLACGAGNQCVECAYVSERCSDKPCCGSLVCYDNVCSSELCAEEGQACENTTDCCGHALECIDRECAYVKPRTGLEGDPCESVQDCAEGFVCTEKGTCKEENNIWIYIGVGAGVFVLVVVVIILIVLLKKRHDKQQAQGA